MNVPSQEQSQPVPCAGGIGDCEDDSPSRPNQSPYAPENQLIVGKEMFQNLGENQDIELSARSVPSRAMS